MSRQLPPPPGVSIQDDTARLIRDGLIRVFKQLKTGQVWSNVRWLFNRSFPTLVHRFDLLVCEPGRSYSEDGSESILDPSAKVVTAIDIVRRECFETDWFDKPDHLEDSRLYEHCLYDPTGSEMRPNLQAWRKQDGIWRRTPTALRGLFFSTMGFCLDVRNHVPRVRRCGRHWHEEELYQARIERARTADTTRLAQLDKEIRALELKVSQPRSVTDDEDDE